MSIISITGDIYENQSSYSRPCTLKVRDNQLMIQYDDLEQAPAYICKLDELRIDPPLGSIRRKVHLPDGRVFETDDLEAVNDIYPSNFWKRIAKTERKGWHIIPIALVTPFLAFGLYRLLVPILVSFGMALTPDIALYSIDKNTMKSLDKFVMKQSEISHDKRVEVQKIFNKLLLARNESPEQLSTNKVFKYSLNFRNSGALGPNAFALPGGTIVITDELILEFPDEDVIAAVLAHEIGHVEHQHSLQQIYRALGMAGMVTMIAGDAGPLLEDVLLEGSAILSLSHSRKHELQSDNYSYELLKLADYQPDGLIQFFDKMDEIQTLPKDGEWMMTHPVGEKRISNIRDKMKADGISPRALTD